MVKKNNRLKTRIASVTETLHVPYVMDNFQHYFDTRSEVLFKISPKCYCVQLGAVAVAFRKRNYFSPQLSILCLTYTHDALLVLVL